VLPPVAAPTSHPTSLLRPRCWLITPLAPTSSWATPMQQCWQRCPSTSASSQVSASCIYSCATPRPVLLSCVPPASIHALLQLSVGAACMLSCSILWVAPFHAWLQLAVSASISHQLLQFKYMLHKGLPNLRGNAGLGRCGHKRL
jgi:hypothetical protein